MGRVVGVGLASVIAGAGWIVLVAQVFNTGYWGAPLPWWLASLLWGAVIMVGFRRKGAFAALAGMTAVIASLAGGVSAVFTLIAIYGTGN